MKYYLIIFLIGSVLLVACKRDYNGIATYQPADSSLAYLKFVHASPNFRQIFGTRDSFNIYIGSQKLNGTLLSYNAVYPFSVNSSTTTISATYSAVPAGAQTIKFSIPGVNGLDSSTVFSVNKSLQAGRYYTFLLTDSIKSSYDSSQIFMQDYIAPLLTGFINLRFVNAVLNDTTGKTVDIFSYARNAVIFGNFKPGGISGFGSYNYNPSVVDTLYVTRPVASSTIPLSQRIILAKLPLNATAVSGGTQDKRSYTLYYKGDGNLTGGTKARSLGVYINR